MQTKWSETFFTPWNEKLSCVYVCYSSESNEICYDFFLVCVFCFDQERMLKKFSEIWHITSCYDQPFADTQYEIVPCQNQVVDFVPRGSRNRNVEHETGQL